MTLSDTTKVPHEWLLPLKALNLAGHKAILAGGCLRDLYCGRKPKDIDIFILNDTPTSSWYRYTKLIDPEALWHSASYRQTTSKYQIDFVTTQDEHHRTFLKSGPKVELIGICGVSNAMDLIRRFDFGLCQIAIENEKIIFTEDFRRDFLFGTFTLTHAFTYEHSKFRYSKWAEKYPGWPMKKKGIVELHEYYKSYNSLQTQHPLEPE